MELDELTGYHLEQAFRYPCELGPADTKAPRLAADAAAHLDVAGRRAMDRADTGAAVNLLERAEALLPPREMNLALQLSLTRVWQSPAGSTMRSRARRGSLITVPPPVTAQAGCRHGWQE